MMKPYNGSLMPPKYSSSIGKKKRRPELVIISNIIILSSIELRVPEPNPPPLR